MFLGEFVLMPNHLHAIVILDKSKCTDVGVGTDGDVVGTDGDIVGTDGNVMETRGCVETHGRASLQYQRQYQPSPPQFQRQPKSISSFVAGFKSSTNKQIDDWIDANHLTMAKFNKNNPLWQSNYHDHIIRNETEYLNISDYIIRNPMEWKEDSLNR